MRAALAIFALILAAVALAALTSHLRPHPDPTLAEESQQKTDDWQKTLDKIQKDKTPNTNDPKHFAAFDPYKTGALRAVLEIENRGVIEMELYPKAAPKTVAHFVDLCHKHFYNGIKFHRVEFDFVAQAGDPTSKDLDPSQFKLTGVGTHGSGQTVPLDR